MDVKVPCQIVGVLKANTATFNSFVRNDSCLISRLLRFAFVDDESTQTKKFETIHTHPLQIQEFHAEPLRSSNLQCLRYCNSSPNSNLLLFANKYTILNAHSISCKLACSKLPTEGGFRTRIVAVLRHCEHLCVDGLLDVRTRIVVGDVSSILV